MGKRVVIVLLVLALIGAITGWIITAPRPLDASVIPAGHQANLDNGRYLFWAGGCASCHAAPCADAPGRTCAANDDAKMQLTGGIAFETPFGKFIAPNISPDANAGIGGWSTLEFVNAMKRGVSPEGSHYYPVFPYTSYQRARIEDLVDLKAFLDTLPPIAEAPPEHEIGFPFNIRRGLGAWKLVAFDGDDFEPDAAASEAVNRGAYLVNGLGHCGECHTPRAMLGIETALAPLDHSRWLGGAPNPEGKGTIPNITPDETGIGSWSEGDIAYALESGFTPDFDSLGGTMTKVIENMAKLTADDREAIAAYLKSIPPVASAKR